MRNLSKKAFSFVELLVVITIMSIVGAIWVSLNDGYKEKTYNTKVETDLVTIENALIRYKQEKSYIPLPEGNLKYFSKDGFYAHDESDAYGYHGFITENTIPKRFISVLPRDPRSNNYYAYGKTLSSGFFEVAGVISYGDKYESIVKGNYIGKDPLYNLIREYNGPDFVYDKSKKNFPYNPEEMIMDARIVAFTGELILNNSITEKNKILESKLLPGDNIKLSTGSTASIYYSDGSYSELGSHDGALELTLSVMKYKKDDNLFTRIRLALNYGTILTKASKMSGESNLDLYTIDTDASVRGTIFEMKRLQGDNKTYVKVIKGSIFLNMINIADYDTLLSLLKDDKEISPKTPISFPGYTEVVTVDGHQESILKEGGDFTITASPTIPPTIPPTCATDEHYETVGGCLKNVDNCNFYDTDGTTLIGTGTKSWNITRGNCEATNCLAGFIIDIATKTCIPNVGLCPTNYIWDGTNCIADTRIYSCLAKPANTVWNSVSSYNQTWNGSDWVPSDSTTHYNTAPNSSSCRFRCNTNYSRNGSSCNPDSRLVACLGSIASNSYRTTGVNYTQTWNGTTWAPVKNWSYNAGTCGFLCNANYSRNGSSCNPVSRSVACGGSIASNSYRTTGVNYTQTWNGTTRAPVKNWSYNAGTCGFLCNANYSRNGSTCAPAVRTYNCGTLSSGKQKNSVSSYTQTWNGTSRSPSNSSYVYNTSSSTTSCRYKCSSGYNRTGSNCIKCNSGYSWDSSVKKCKKTISGNGCSSCPYGYSNGPRYGNCSSSSGNRRYKVCNGLGVTCGLEKSWSFSDTNCNKIENYSWSATIYQ